MLHGRRFRSGAGGEVEAQRDHSAASAEMPTAVVEGPNLVQGRLWGLAILELHDADMLGEPDLHVGAATTLVYFRLEFHLHQLAQDVQHEVAVRLAAQLLAWDAGQEGVEEITESLMVLAGQCPVHVPQRPWIGRLSVGPQQGMAVGPAHLVIGVVQVQVPVGILAQGVITGLEHERHEVDIVQTVGRAHQVLPGGADPRAGGTVPAS